MAKHLNWTCLPLIHLEHKTQSCCFIQTHETIFYLRLSVLTPVPLLKNSNMIWCERFAVHLKASVNNSSNHHPFVAWLSCVSMMLQRHNLCSKFAGTENKDATHERSYENFWRCGFLDNTNSGHHSPYSKVLFLLYEKKSTVLVQGLHSYYLDMQLPSYTIRSQHGWFWDVTTLHLHTIY